MSEARAAKCDSCGTVESIRMPDSSPTGWLILFGLIDGERRHDFCSPRCLYNWTPQLVSQRVSTLNR